MKTKVTIPVLLTLEVSEPNAAEAEALVRELVGAGCSGTLHPQLPQLPEMFATVACSIALQPV